MSETKLPTQQPGQAPSAELIAKRAEHVEGETAEVKGSPEGTKLEPGVPETLTKNVDEKGKKKDPLDIVGSISVRPYVDGTSENMGLENYGFVVFPGTAQEEQLAAIERNGVVRYITGLNEYAPEVQHMNDEKKKEAVIRNIRTIVAKLERELASNQIKVDDEEFWNKVTIMKPDNHEFWAQISIRCANEPVYLNPKTDPYDLIKFMAIEAGGFDIVAKSYEDAQTKAQPPKFYLDKEVDTVSTRTVYKKLRNKAIGILEALANKKPKKLFYVTKALDTYSAQYKSSTPADIMYEAMDEYIAGNGVEGNKTRAAEHFIAASELDMETLKLKAIVKDASFYKFVTLKPDGMIYHTASGSMLGRNVSDVVEALKSPLNEEVLTRLQEEVDEYWNQ
jgi:hypothetical protein